MKLRDVSARVHARRSIKEAGARYVGRRRQKTIAQCVDTHALILTESWAVRTALTIRAALHTKDVRARAREMKFGHGKKKLSKETRPRTLR